MCGKTCTVTTEKKLGSNSPLFATFYTSPALISTNKYHLLYKQTSDQFSLAHLWGWDPLPLSFPISWYCKLDTGMQKPKLHPELQMQHKGCRWTCCSDLPIPQALYPPGMVLNQEDQKAWNGPPHQPPSSIHKTAAKSVKRPRSWHNTARG